MAGHARLWRPAGPARLRRPVSPARLWRSSLRLRLTTAGVVLAAVIFAIGGVLTITLYHRSLTTSVRNSVAQVAAEVAKRATADRLPDPIPMPVGPDVPRVQVLNSSNQVITGDPSSAAKPAMFRLANGAGRREAVVSAVGVLPGASADVYALRVATQQGQETVVAALSLRSAAVRTTIAAESAAAACGLALLVVGIVAWLTTGRALRPVERMRAQAEAITASADLSGRLPSSGADELTRLGDTLNEMLASLERSVDRHRRFIADAAHELRTPLAGLTAALEVAQDHPEGGGETLVDDLLAGHRRLSRTVNDLLVLATLDGHAPRRMVPVDLAGVVTDCSRRSAPDGVRLQVGTLERVLVLGSESQLSRMIGNLVDNGLRYAGSTVELSLSAHRGWAQISVADDGPGIPEPDRERIWGRFVRLDDDRSRASGGSGLGLAMVRELAAAHGGTATVNGRGEGTGTVFTVRLPAHQPD